MSEPQQSLCEAVPSDAHDPPSAGDLAFVRALVATDRSAWTKFKKSRGILSTDEAGVKAAAEEFRQVDLLSDRDLRALSMRAIAAARGRLALANDKFPAVLWLGGATVTWDGREFLGTLADFVRVLVDRAQALAPKRSGWVIEPVTNPEGRRTNEKTLAVHALFLDCDSNGEWDALLTMLRSFNYAFVAYQSGGWSPTSPKWRVVLPLHAPHDTSTEAGQQSWKTLYNCARVVFGCIGELRGIGFDPATETPCCPWFLTERRETADPPRTVVWQTGHALDLVSMVMELPEVPEREVSHGDVDAADRIELDDERAEEIVEALAAATNRVSSGRRDIYMALPGVLLDRGIEPEMVLQIVEAVSERYPRSHPEKHADNVHCAKTTIAKWENEGAVTRIGTLQSVAPEVAAAVDDVLPSGDQKFRLFALQLFEGQTSIPESIANMVSSNDDGEVVPDWQKPVDLKTLRKFAMQLRRKKSKWKETQSVKDGIHWELLTRMLDKKPLCSPQTCDATTQLNSAQSIDRLACVLAFKFPRDTPGEAVLELVRPTLCSMLGPDDNVDHTVNNFKQSYTKSLAFRLEKDAERAAKIEAEHIERARATRRHAR